MLIYFLGFITGIFVAFFALMMFALVAAAKDDERSEGGETNAKED